MSGPFFFGDAMVFLNPVDDMVHAHRSRTGSFEPEAMRQWYRICDDVDKHYVADIGAYTGLYAIGANLLGCDAWAYEPHAANFHRLIQNCEANQARVHCCPYALGCPQNGHSYSAFAYNPGVPLTSGGGIKGGAHYAPVKAHQNTVQVNVYALDAMAPSHGFDAMKIDVEGAELDVLRGAQKILHLNRPDIILECLTDSARKDIGEFLSGFGYTGQQLDDRNHFFQSEA